MACPYFEPAVRFHAKMPGPFRLSLGDLYTGTCRANPEAGFQPDDRAIVDHCNLGYARLKCPRFPQNGGPDAIRFSITKDDGSLVTISFAIERDHHPFAHGAMEYGRESGGFQAATQPGTLVETQAAAYVRSYLRRLE